MNRNVRHVLHARERIVAAAAAATAGSERLASVRIGKAAQIRGEFADRKGLNGGEGRGGYRNSARAPLLLFRRANLPVSAR